MKLKDELLKGANAHSFVWRNEVYFLHATYQNAADLVGKHGAFHASQEPGPVEQLYSCLRKDPQLAGTPIMAAVISRVFDDPLIEAEVEPAHMASQEAQQELKEFRDQMVELNGINFWRMYYEQMGFKAFVDGMVSDLTNGKETSDSVSLEMFLSLATTGYFLHCIDQGFQKDEVHLMESSPSDYVFTLCGDPPKERDDVAYFFMWRKS